MTWVILWFVIGFITFLLLCAEDMRGVEYRYAISEHRPYFFLFVLMTAAGVLGFAIYAIIRIKEEDLFTKLIYKIVNIGVKKDVGEEV